MKWDSKEIPPPAAPVTQLLLPHYGTTLNTPESVFKLEELREHFSSNLPALEGTIANQTIDAFLNFRSVDQWMKGIKEELLAEMWAQGFRDRKSFSSPIIREFYLDRVLARHAFAKGFEVQKDGMPFGLYTSTGYFFLRVLKLGRFFVDWTGVTLRSGVDQKSHFVRGHSLQMAYAADRVVNFVELPQFIGKYGDTYSTWFYIFDNVVNTSTPFWGGYWVSRYGAYLGIRY